MAKKRKPKRSPARKQKPSPKPKPESASPNREIVAKPVALTLPETIERVLLSGDLAPLSVEQRLEYYKTVCKSLGLNPFTRPLEYIVLNGKMTLYARKDCTDQLRRLYSVGVTDSKRESEGELCIVTVKVMDKNGKTDIATGAVSVKGLATTDLANAIMKAETKAKRRATLSICGLGMLDESEVEDIDQYGLVTPQGRVMYEAGKKPQWGGSRSKGEASVAAEVDRQLAEHKAVVDRQTAAKQPPTTPKPAEIVAPEPSQAQPTGKKASLGVVEVDWTGHPGAPIVRGAIENLLPMIQKHCTATWAKDEWWHVLGTDVPTIKKMCAELGFEFREILPARSSGGAAMTSPEKPTARGRAQSASPAPAVVSGTIERVNSGMAGKAPVKYVTLLLADKSKPCFGCFHKSMFDALEKGVGKLATLIVLTKGQYTNIEGLRKIGSKEWDADGLPVIQNAQREAGGRTLFP